MTTQSKSAIPNVAVIASATWMARSITQPSSNRPESGEGGRPRDDVAWALSTRVDKVGSLRHP